MTAFSSQECFFLKAFDEPQRVITDKLWKTDLDRGELRFAWYAGPYWKHGLITCTLFSLGYRSLSFSLSLAYSPPFWRSTFSPAVSIEDLVNSGLCPVGRASVVNRK